MAGTNSVTIDLPEGEDLTERIVSEAARQALRMLTAAGPDGEQSEVPTALGRRIEEVVTETIREEARAAAPKVADCRRRPPGRRSADSHSKQHRDRPP